MSARTRRATAAGRKQREFKRPRERPADVLDCQKCDRPAVEIYAPVMCRALLRSCVLCGKCNEGLALVFHWHFVVPNNPHPFLSDDPASRIRCTVHGTGVDLSCSRVTFIP